MSLQRITLTLARSKDHPAGSSRHGYEIVAPLDEDGHLDSALWASTKQACTVRRFWGVEAADLGHLVHRGGPKGGSWSFHYDIAGDEDDEAGFRFGAHSFNVGDYVSIRDDDGVMHTFIVGVIEPA